MSAYSFLDGLWEEPKESKASGGPDRAGAAGRPHARSAGSLHPPPALPPTPSVNYSPAPVVAQPVKAAPPPVAAPDDAAMRRAMASAIHQEVRKIEDERRRASAAPVYAQPNPAPQGSDSVAFCSCPSCARSGRISGLEIILLLFMIVIFVSIVLLFQCCNRTARALAALRASGLRWS